MIEKMPESSGRVIGYKAVGTITASDFKKLEPEVKSLVEKEGNVRMLFDLSDFKWEKIEAWLPDLKFGRRQNLGEVDGAPYQAILCSRCQVLPLCRYRQGLGLAPGVTSRIV
jgi:hypothetical protein